jgi:pyruvate dehydrogenase E2 component (dihydrolipoamide acetyltransferase)
MMYCRHALRRAPAAASGGALRAFGSRTRPLAAPSSSFPDHEILPLAALSPTMEFGGVASWVKREGEAIHAGDVVLELETDKATLDFEAQDDSFLARILVEAGTSDLPVGTPLAVLVEDEADIAAFASATAADFALADGSAAEQATAAAAAPEPAAAAAEPVAVAAPTPVAPAAAPTPAAPRPAGDVDVILSSDRYGTSMRTSTLSAFLLEQQAAYVAKYGSTGLEVPAAAAE